MTWFVGRAYGLQVWDEQSLHAKGREEECLAVTLAAQKRRNSAEISSQGF